jgi:hypothetical protein
MKIEYCILSVECLISLMNWHLITTHYKQHKAYIFVIKTLLYMHNFSINKNDNIKSSDPFNEVALRIF